MTQVVAEPVVWVIGYAEEPAQVFFAIWDGEVWRNGRDDPLLPQDLEDEVIDEILCDDFRYRGLDWRSREATHDGA